MLRAFANGACFQEEKPCGDAAENQFVIALKTPCILLLPLCLPLTACGPASTKMVSELEAELRLGKAGREKLHSENEEPNCNCEDLENQTAGVWINLA